MRRTGALLTERARLRHNDWLPASSRSLRRRLRPKVEDRLVWLVPGTGMVGEPPVLIGPSH